MKGAERLSVAAQGEIIRRPVSTASISMEQTLVSDGRARTPEAIIEERAVQRSRSIKSGSEEERWFLQRVVEVDMVESKQEAATSPLRDD
jgi:hypothetical protein